MADSKIEIIITAKDKASAPIGKINRTLGKMGGAFKGAAVAGIATGTLALAAFGAGLAKTISMGSDTNEMMGKFNVVFGEYARSTEKHLDALAAATGRSKFQVRAMASTLQDTFVPLGFARDNAAKLSEQMSKLAIDVGSFNNVSDAQVMEDFQSAIVGNHETVRKYGIVITQAALDQELLNEGVKWGIKNATEQQKVMARVNLIMAGTTDAQGDAVRTGKQWANQTRALKAALGDMGAEIGLKLLPVITPLLQRFTEMIRDVGPKLVVIVGQIIDSISAFWALHGADIKAKALALWNWLQTYVPEVITGVRDTVEEVLGAMQAFWALHGKAITETAKKLWKMVKRVFGDAIGIIKLDFKLFSQVLTGDWEGAKKTLIKIWQKAWDQIKAILTTMTPIVVHLAARLGRKVWEKIKHVDWFGLGKSVIQGILDGMASLEQHIGQWIWDMFKRQLDRFRSIIPNLFGGKSAQRRTGSGSGLSHVRRQLPSYTGPSTPFIPSPYSGPSLRMSLPTFGTMGGDALQFVYAPAVSAATQREVEQVLRPALDRWYQGARRRRV